MEYICKRLQTLTPEEKTRLRELTLATDSYMATVLADNPVESCCWLAIENNKIWGWSLVRWFTPDVRSYTFAYVSVLVSAARWRRGIGRALLAQAFNYAGEQQLTPCVFAITAGQRDFFKACQVAASVTVQCPFPRTYWQNYRFARKMLLQL